MSYSNSSGHDLNAECDLQAYGYDLPESLIAQAPASPRDSSRLLVVNRTTQSWEHRSFQDLVDYLDARDLVVANNSRVLKARLLGHRLSDGDCVGGKVEFVLLNQLRPKLWEGLFRASARSRPGLRFFIPTPEGGGLIGKVVRGAAESLGGTVVVEFDQDPIASGAGELPLPHYIKPNPGLNPDQSYQTVYAKTLGSAAAPTAGLHFTERVLDRLRSKGVQWDEVTLHVGVGTFRPVKEKDIRKHLMHEESYEISDESAQKITDWKKAGHRIFAVGTTSVRTLESACSGGCLQSGWGKTSIFIRSGYSFQIVDRLLTNFHLPYSTLLMLVSAFAGRELILAAYAEAVREKYRFFSYGDAMLII